MTVYRSKRYDVGDPLPEGNWASYRKKGSQKHMKLDHICICSNRENEENHGLPGDYLAKDDHGGYYIISEEYHDKNYEAAE